MAGGGYIEHAGEAYIIRGDGLIQKPEEISGSLSRRGRGPRHRRPAWRGAGWLFPRIGAATIEGEGEAVIAMTLMLTGENGRVVAKELKRRFEERFRAFLPVSASSPSMTARSLSTKSSRPLPKILQRERCSSSPFCFSCWETCAAGLSSRQ